ncbi:MAG TPA: 4-(cytidine 5'-diphospho)-2-C-methyl-D-erythritol kinase [Gammaproteobacteria bacterium]|nr:4-(cytidine 5'-diphospho)-2-C-methyl-D-erythritol kinase [Gammaproteobacteria bacterium]
MNSEPWPAPAKLNLFLHITGRRPDGYHSLQTVFQFLDFGDSLRFETRRDSGLRRVNPVADLPENSDICLRAARLLQQSSGTKRGVDIYLEKRIPMGGGLGGGSSDAATTLLALNRLWGLDYGLDKLVVLGLQLGADVPVFVQGRSAWGEGVGEQLQFIELPEAWYLVIAPPVQVSTAEIFNAPDLTRNCPPITIRDFLTGHGRNVCEPVVRQRYPAVDRTLTWLAQYTEARMTGTGACVFGRFRTESEARAVLELHGKDPGGVAFVAKGLSRSPLLQAYGDPI